jgi:aspartate aminotransferase
MTMKVTALAAELRARGADVISLSAGEPDFDTPAHIKEAAKRALDGGATKYTPVEGVPRLRTAAAAWLGRAHGIEISPEEIIVTAGAKQAIHHAFHALLNPGDEVLLPAPCWVSYAEIAKLAGAIPIPVLAQAAGGFAIDPDALEAAVTRSTRMLVLSSPSNPTGALVGERTVRALAELALRHDHWLLTDDIYRGLCYGGARFVGPARLGPEIRRRTVIVDGVSKSYAMTGWRIGFGMAPREVIAAMGTLQGQSTTNAAAVSQAAAIAALEGPQDELERMRVAFDDRRKLMVSTLRAMPGVTCVEPQGAFYAFPDVSAFVGRHTPAGRTITDDVALCEHLLEAAQVAVVPGSAFFAPGFVRLSYAASMANIEKALSRMAEVLSQLR